MSGVEHLVSETPVPAVPAAAGPRVMTLISAALGAFSLVFLAIPLVGEPAAVADELGLADTSTAQVTDRTFRPLSEYSRGCDSYYDFDVAWDDREGHFSTCIGSGGPLVDLEVGDQVEVASVSWSSTVVAEGNKNPGFWALGSIVLGLFLLAQAAVWVRRYRRLMRGTARGTLMTGRVEKPGRTVTSVLLDDRRLVLLPAKHVMYLAPGDPAEVWSTRRSLFRKRPRGPWVMRARSQFGVFTHAWWRKPRS